MAKINTKIVMLKGEQGIQGEKGADGITYTPVIGTVTTVASTSDATADIIVDSVAKTATFNFAIPKGANGAIGGKGDKGEKGDTGEKGDAGVDGITYIPTIGTVSTIDSASEASASVDIDTDNARATFNFSIPRGADGLQGLQGIQGLQDIQGEAGKDGKDGTTYTPSIGEVTTVDSNELASASVSVNTETKEAVFNFAIPKGNKGLDGVQISDNETVESKTWSSQKTSSEIAEKVGKTDIATTISSTSTDTQVPSAKAVWNKSKNKIQRLLDGVDIIVYADSISNEMVTDTVRIMNATNSPYGVDNVNNDFYYTIYNVNDDKYKRILAYNIRKNNMYMIIKNNNIWGAWQEIAIMDKVGIIKKEIEITISDTSVSHTLYSKFTDNLFSQGYQIISATSYWGNLFESDLADLQLIGFYNDTTDGYVWFNSHDTTKLGKTIKIWVFFSKIS